MTYEEILKRTRKFMKQLESEPLTECEKRHSEGGSGRVGRVRENTGVDTDTKRNRGRTDVLGRTQKGDERIAYRKLRSYTRSCGTVCR